MSIIEVEALAKTFRTRERAAGLAIDFVAYFCIADLRRFHGDIRFPGLLPGQYRGIDAADAWCTDHVQYLSDEHFYRCCKALTLHSNSGRVRLIRAFAVVAAV